MITTGSSKRRVFPLAVDTTGPWSAVSSGSASSSAGDDSLDDSSSAVAAISGGFARGGSRAPPPPKSPLHGARHAASSNSGAQDAAPTRGMLQLRQMNVTSSAGYQSTGVAQLPPILHPAPPLATSPVHEVSAAQNHKERKLAEAKRRLEVQCMAREDYTDTPEGDARRRRQAERAQMHEEELSMMRIVQAEHAAARDLALQRAREDDARVREMYLSKLRAAREDAERAAQEQARARQLALEAKMRALKDAADAQARHAYAARQRQLQADALCAREQRIAAAETALLAVEDELAAAMAHADAMERERLAQIAAEEAQWKRFEAIEAQKQRDATALRRAAQAAQYEQDKQRRMEIHRLQKERARLAEQRGMKHAAVGVSLVAAGSDDPRTITGRPEAELAATDGETDERHGVDNGGADCAVPAEAGFTMTQADESNQSEHDAARAAAPDGEKAVDADRQAQTPQIVDAGDAKQLQGPIDEASTLSSPSPTADTVARLDDRSVMELDLHIAPATSLDPEPASVGATTLEDTPRHVDASDTCSSARPCAALQGGEGPMETSVDCGQAGESASEAVVSSSADEAERVRASDDAYHEQLADDCAVEPSPRSSPAADRSDLSRPHDAPDAQQPRKSDALLTDVPDATVEEHEIDSPAQTLVHRVVSLRDAQTQLLQPFAQVLHVKAGSPAMVATLQARDLLIDFGGITATTPNCLLLIAERVMSALDQDIALVVLRPEQQQVPTDSAALSDELFALVSLSLRPRKWTGKGLLGCQLHPFKWPLQQQQQQEEPVVDTGATSAGEALAQDGGNSSANLLVFYNVAPASLADSAGIRNGDLLMRCGALAVADDLESVLAYVEIAKAARSHLELALARWIPDAQAYESLTVVLAVSEATPLGCSLTTFAAYYSSSGSESAAPALASACMDCYYTALATAVHAAALNGHVSCLEALLEAARHDTSDSGESSGAGILDWRDDDGRSPLFYACYAQQVETVRFLLAHMAQDEPYDAQTGGDRYGDSPLHAAALSGSTEILALLLEHSVLSVDVANATQLTCAHVAPSVDVLELLGERFGADLLAVDADGRMPLSHACLRHDLASVQYLCRKHPDFVDYADARGNTPLHLAAWLGHVDVVRELVQHVPPIALYVPNEDGANPLEVAQASGADDTVAFLASCMGAASSREDGDLDDPS